MSGTLYVLGTPIGNLEDLSPRALRTLREVAAVACEDTRTTLKLLSHFQKLERDLRNEVNLTKIEYASSHDDKMRKLAEERVALQKDYEHKLRELEARQRKQKE